MGGLESLIPKKTQALPTPKKESIFWIEVDKIKPNPSQPRKDFNKESLKTLANSIREYGVLQPLIVSKVEKEDSWGRKVEYQLVAGERRLRAAEMAGFSQVPVIIRTPKLEEKLLISLVENIQRHNLNPIEEATAFRKLHKDFGMAHKEIAKIMGRSREAVTNTIRFLNLPLSIQKALIEGKISEGQSKAILTLKDSQQQKVLYDKVIQKGLIVREVEEMARQMAKVPVKKVKKIIPELKELKERVSKILGINKVICLVTPKGKTRLTIVFDSQKQINDFLSKLK